LAYCKDDNDILSALFLLGKEKERASPSRKCKYIYSSSRVYAAASKTRMLGTTQQNGIRISPKETP
jgi:hypothetical protein